MNITEWVRAGFPTRRFGSWPNWRYRFTCNCDVPAERRQPQEHVDRWFKECPLCRSGYRATEGMKEIPGVGYTSQENLLGGWTHAITPSMPGPEASTPAISSAMLPTNGFKPTTTQQLSGGRTMGLAPSVCKGPYNRKGSMCIPKADCKQRAPSDPCVPYSLAGALISEGIEAIGGTKGPGAPGNQSPGYGPTSPCPPGYEWDGQDCVEPGLLGSIKRRLPGGESGTAADVYGDAVMGAWGKPALVPYTEQRVVRRCPPGAVLGKDGLCYPRQQLPRNSSNRMWPLGRKPMFTAGDMNALARAERLKDKAKDIASYWYSCKLK